MLHVNNKGADQTAHAHSLISTFVILSLESIVVKLATCYVYIVMGGSREGMWGPDPPENHKNIVFFSKTGPDPLKNHKATKPAFNFGPLSACQRNTGEAWSVEHIVYFSNRQ